MEITDVRIRKVKNQEGKLKAFASVVIENCFVVHDIKIVENEGGYIISMPSRKGPNGEFKDIAHPLDTPTRELIKAKILDKYAQEE